MAAMYAGAPQHDFCNAGDTGKLCDLLRNVIPVDRRNVGTCLLCHTNVLL